MLLVYWYSKLCVYVKWGNCISNVIPVQCGTRQGGLTSPFIFNVFYKDLIDELSACDNGVSIKGNMFNVYCYADDILISSTSVTGLQCLINKANRYIKQHGLRFNPSKTSCMLFGNNPFDSLPVWTIDGVNLQIESSITYLGAELSPHGGNKHTESRIRSTQRAFYSLQGAGLNKDGVSPHTAMEIINTGIRPVLEYGCASVFLSKQNLSDMDKIQSKYIKAVLGLRNQCRNTPILQALRVTTVSRSIQMSYLSLFKIMCAQ